MPPKWTSSTQKCANQRMETASMDFMMHTHSGLPINQHMNNTKTSLPPTKKIKPIPLPRRTLVMNFNDYSALLSWHAKISTATTDPCIDTESETQDYPKINDPVTEDESDGEGEVEAHKGNLVDDPKACESLPVSDTPENEDEEVPAPPLKAKLFKKCVLSNTPPKNSTVIETSLTAPKRSLTGMTMNIKMKKPQASDEEAPTPPSKATLFKKSVLSNTLPSSALPKNSMAMETASPIPQLYSFDDVSEDLPIASRPGRLCQEGVDDAQELRCKTLEAAKAIGAKYGKSAHTILIEAGLSVKHSRAETPWNMHQGWYKGKYPREKDEQLSDWRKRQCDHYYSLPDDDPLWDDVQAYYNFHLGSANNNQSHASIVMSTRDTLAKCFAAYSCLEGIEVIGCVFNLTPDEVA
ncbi:uncharacterized protein BJ212DRAFT_1480875 [Suillus subaureus]|uniref:Uncharacterized protein n=1 Tax=Suillus subaureus TaxID=48587 RepID=A0A9P7EBY3_9AGAM|nr:uncharacterized protein BJ212DRAFT_1480875 [Suillus subaureus]KAG1816427.1 hypothetical protein BJ212DRAFT_1480875 [Suillus subaureus]